MRITFGTDPDISMPRFVPIADIDGYINCLRRDGESEERLAEIRAKHTAHLPPPPEPREPQWQLPVKFLDDVYLKLKVTEDGVRVKIIAPFEEFRKYTGKPVPLAVRVRCFKLAGAPNDILMGIIRRQNAIESKEYQKKLQKWLDKNHKAPVKKILKSVKKKIIPK